MVGRAEVTALGWMQLRFAEATSKCYLFRCWGKDTLLREELVRFLLVWCWEHALERRDANQHGSHPKKLYENPRKCLWNHSTCLCFGVEPTCIHPLFFKERVFWGAVNLLPLKTCPPCAHHASASQENTTSPVPFPFYMQTISICGVRWQQLPHCPVCSGNLEAATFRVPLPDTWVPSCPPRCWNNFPGACSGCNPAASPLLPPFCLRLKNCYSSPDSSFSHLHPDFGFQEVTIFFFYHLLQVKQIFFS